MYTNKNITSMEYKYPSTNTNNNTSMEFKHPSTNTNKNSMEFNYSSTDTNNTTPMEFKYPLTNNDNYPRSSYFSQQAIQGSIFSKSTGGFENPRSIREEIEREMEKEKIRQEILAEEMARRRLLEAEVRRELQMEREMGMDVTFRREFTSFGGGGFRSGLSFEERIGLSLQQRLGKTAGSSSFYRSGGLKIEEIKPSSDAAKDKAIVVRNGEPRISEVKCAPEVDKKKVIILAKSDATFSGEKRKAVTSLPTGNNMCSSMGPNKKLKEEWSCAICQVTATSERGLNDHLAGKKHKSKETALITQRTGKNIGLGLVPKKTTIPIIKVEKSMSEKRKELVLVGKKSESSLQKVSKSGNPMGRPKVVDKNKMKFWCEMCQVGAFTEKVMNNHKKGKKHRAGLLQDIVHNGGSTLLLNLVKSGGDVVEPAQVEDGEADSAECKKEEAP